MGKLDLRYTTKTERTNILQAIKIIDQIYESHSHVSMQSYRLWESKFISRRWIKKYGAFKKAFIKGNVVAKIGPTVQLNREMSLWKKTRNEPEFRQFRKNLARIFGVYRGFLIQRKVKKPNDQEEYCECSPPTRAGRPDTKCKAVAVKLKITDWWHNHGHDNNGNPVFFDSIVDNR